MIKRSKIVRLTTMVAASAAVVGCGSSQPNGWDDNGNYIAQRDTAICTRNGVRVDDDQCKRGGHGSAFMWYYLGRSSTVPYHGETVRGGSFQRKANGRYFLPPKLTNGSRAHALKVGGFGSSRFSGRGG